MKWQKLGFQLQKRNLILLSAISAVKEALASVQVMKSHPLPNGLLDKVVNDCLAKQQCDTI